MRPEPVPVFLWRRVTWYLVPSTLYLGCVPPLLEVTLRKFFPLLSVFCSSRPCCSLPLHDVIFPSHFGSAPRSSSFPHLPLCCAYCPPIVLHSCHMSSPSPFCIRYVFYDVEYIGSYGFSTYPDTLVVGVLSGGFCSFEVSFL